MNTYDVLIVDDEAGIREMVSEFAEMAGLVAATAGDADQALDILEKQVIPPLLVCDISMPGISGLQLLEKIKALNFPCSVVMLTAHAEGEKIIQALQLGAIDYVTKPFNSEELIAKLPVWLEIGRRMQSTYLSTGGTEKALLASQTRMIDLLRLKNKKIGSSVA